MSWTFSAVRRTVAIASIAATFSTFSTVAFANNPFAGAEGFNAVIFGNLNATAGDTEGRLAVGGNLTASSYAVGPNAPADANANSLVVGGDLNAIGGWQVFNGNTKYGGSLINAPSFVSPYTLQQASNVYDFAGRKSEFVSISNALAGLADNGTQLYQWTTYTLTGTNSGLNVFNVNAADWAAASNRIIDAPTGSTVLINVLGTSGSLANGMALQGGIDRTRVMFNYSQATSLTFSNIAVEGSVLAPNAALTLSSGNINGISVFDSALTQNGGEFHNWTFNGSAPVPEPMTMIGIATMAGLVARRRFKKKS